MKRLVTHGEDADPRLAQLAAAIERFDGLASDGASVETFVEAAAELSGLPTGLVDFVRCRVVLSSPAAAPADDVVAAVVAYGLRGREASLLALPGGRSVVAASVDVANGRIGVAWCALGKKDEPTSHEVVVERLAAAVASLFARDASGSQSESHAPLARVLEGTSSAVEALREVGLDTTRRHLVIGAEVVPAGSVSPEVLDAAMRREFSRQGGLAVVGAVRSLSAAVTHAEVDVHRLHETLRSSLPAGTNVAVAFALSDPSIPAAWRAVVRALERRQSTGSPIDADACAIEAALVLSADEFAESSDVQRILALSPEERHVLAVALDAGSLRRAGARLHMHHTTVAYHLDRISERLGFRVLGSEGRTRPVLALAAAEAVEARRRGAALSGESRTASG